LQWSRKAELRSMEKEEKETMTVDDYLLEYVGVCTKEAGCRCLVESIGRDGEYLAATFRCPDAVVEGVKTYALVTVYIYAPEAAVTNAVAEFTKLNRTIHITPDDYPEVFDRLTLIAGCLVEAVRKPIAKALTYRSVFDFINVYIYRCVTREEGE